MGDQLLNGGPNENESLEDYVKKRSRFYERKAEQIVSSNPSSSIGLRYYEKADSFFKESEEMRRKRVVETEKFNPIFNDALLMCLRAFTKSMPREKREESYEALCKAVDLFNSRSRDFQITILKEAEEAARKREEEKEEKNKGTNSI